MKFLARLFLLAGFILVGWLGLGAQSTAAGPTLKTVLVLSPFQLDLSTNLIAAQAMREEFGNAADLSLDVYFEYLDLNRFPDEVYLRNIFGLLKSKYANKPVDLVIVSSEAMLKLWLAQRAEILPQTSVVFLDVFTEHLALFSLPEDVTGVSGVEDCEKSVRWILNVLPAVHEIVLVGGVGKIEQGFFDHIHNLQEDVKGLVKFTDLSGLSLAEIKLQASKLPKTSVILYHPMFEDAQGNKYRPLEVVRDLTAVSSVPIIGGYDQFIGAGIIGGYMYSIDQQARDAAQMSLQLLRGEKMSALPIAQNKSNRFIFDHLVLLRFNIPLSLLPPDSIIKNRQYSFWELYQPQIIAAGASMVVLLLLVVFLLGLTRQLNRTRLALAHLNQNLENQVQERTALLNETNAQLQIEIGEHKQAEEQLRESEEKFRGLLDSQEGSIMIYDFDGVHQYANRVSINAATNLKGEQNIIGKRLHDLYSASTADWQLEKIRHVFATGQGLAGDFEDKLDSPYTWWHLNLQPIRNASGEVTLVMVNAMDITERIHVEEQLRETRDALQTIFYSSPLAIFTLDAEDRVTMWNPAAEAMFGWSEKQILGQTNPTVPENKLKEYAALRHATLNGMAFSNLDTVRQKQNGEQFPVSLSVAPLRGQQNQVVGRMHIIADITERKKLQEELRHQATTDELTRIPNRRHFLELAHNEIRRAIRLKRQPAIALIDIDHFKHINDTYGHAVGDQALIKFTEICQTNIREIDVFARFGGDEFIVLMPETNQEQASQVVERVRLALETHPLELSSSSVVLTISSGVTSFSGGQESIETLLSQADQALYRAKETGRNKVVRYDQLRA